jgi:hypothetical protein
MTAQENEMLTYRRALLILAVAFCVSAVNFRASMCSTPGPTGKTPATSQPPITKESTIKELIPLKGASKVRHDEGWGNSLHVAYGLNEKYPAQDILSQIGGRLKKLGWEPLKEDWLNPGTPSSHVTGWSEFMDEQMSPVRHVHQWLGQWKNGTGDVVIYAFTYSYPRKGKQDLQSLWINGSWYPASTVTKMKAATRKH